VAFAFLIQKPLFGWCEWAYIQPANHMQDLARGYSYTGETLDLIKEMYPPLEI